MDKELKKEIKELKLHSLESKQESKMGSIDSLFIAYSLSILSIIIAFNFSSLKDSFLMMGSFGNYALIWVFYLVLIIPALLYSVFIYPYSIFYKENRFRNKINVFTIILGIFNFLGFLLIVLIILWLLEQKLKLIIPVCLVNIIMAFILLMSIIITFAYSRNKIKNYFIHNFPTILFKVINVMNKKERDKNLKSLGISLNKLKHLAHKG